MSQPKAEMRNAFINVDGINLVLAQPWFVDQTVMVGGHLHDNFACMACWYYYLVAHDSMIKVGTGAPSDTQILTYDVDSSIMEMPQWMDKRYLDQANSVARLYGVESLDQMFAYWPQVILEAARLGMPNPEFEYMNPKPARIT